MISAVSNHNIRAVLFAYLRIEFETEKSCYSFVCIGHCVRSSHNNKVLKQMMHIVHCTYLQLSHIIQCVIVNSIVAFPYRQYVTRRIVVFQCQMRYDTTRQTRYIPIIWWSVIGNDGSTTVAILIVTEYEW